MKRTAGQDRVQCIFGCKEKQIKRQMFEEAEKSSVVVGVFTQAAEHAPLGTHAPLRTHGRRQVSVYRPVLSKTLNCSHGFPVVFETGPTLATQLSARKHPAKRLCHVVSYFSSRRRSTSRRRMSDHVFLRQDVKCNALPSHSRSIRLIPRTRCRQLTRTRRQCCTARGGDRRVGATFRRRLPATRCGEQRSPVSLLVDTPDSENKVSAANADTPSVLYSSRRRSTSRRRVPTTSSCDKVWRATLSCLSLGRYA